MGNISSREQLLKLQQRLKQLEELLSLVEPFYLANVKVKQSETEGFVDVEIVRADHVEPPQEICQDAVPFRGKPKDNTGLLQQHKIQPLKASNWQHQIPPQEGGQLAEHVELQQQPHAGLQQPQSQQDQEQYVLQLHEQLQRDRSLEKQVLQEQQQLFRETGQQSKAVTEHQQHQMNQDQSRQQIHQQNQQPVLQHQIEHMNLQQTGNPYSNYIGPNVGYNGMLNDVCNGMTTRDLSSVKMLIKPDPITESLRSIPSSFLEQIATPQDLMTQLEHQLLLSPLNLFFLQFLMIRIDRRDLHKIIYRYGKSRGNTLQFFVSDRPRDSGWMYVDFHFQGSLAHFEMGDIDQFRGYLQQELGIPLEYINVSGIQPGSVIVTFQLPESCAENVETMIREQNFCQRYKIKAAQIDGQDLVTFNYPDNILHQTTTASVEDEKGILVESETRLTHLQKGVEMLLDANSKQQEELEQYQMAIQDAKEEVEKSKEAELVLEARLVEMSNSEAKLKERILQLEKQRAEDADTVQVLRFEKEKLRRENQKMKEVYEGGKSASQSANRVNSGIEVGLRSASKSGTTGGTTKPEADVPSQSTRKRSWFTSKSTLELEKVKAENLDLRNTCRVYEEKLQQMEEQLRDYSDQVMMPGESKADSILKMSAALRETQVFQVDSMTKQTERLIRIIKEQNIEMQYCDEEESQAFDSGLKEKVSSLIIISMTLEEIKRWLKAIEVLCYPGRKLKENRSKSDSDVDDDMKSASEPAESMELGPGSIETSEDDDSHTGIEMKMTRTREKEEIHRSSANSVPDEADRKAIHNQSGSMNAEGAKQKGTTTVTKPNDGPVLGRFKVGAQIGRLNSDPDHDEMERSKEREAQFIDPFIMALSNVLAMNTAPSLPGRNVGIGSGFSFGFSSGAGMLAADDSLGMICSPTDRQSLKYESIGAVPFASQLSPTANSHWHIGSSSDLVEPNHQTAESCPEPNTDSTAQKNKEVEVSVYLNNEQEKDSEKKPEWILCCEIGMSYKQVVKMIGNMVFSKTETTQFTVIDLQENPLDLFAVIEEDEPAVQLRVVTVLDNDKWVWQFDKSDGIRYNRSKCPEQGMYTQNPRSRSLSWSIGGSKKIKIDADTKYNDLPVHLIKTMCYKLKANQDWKRLARVIGKTENQIRQYSEKSDPCLTMLQEWGKGKHATVGALLIALRSTAVNRPDIANEIDKS